MQRASSFASRSSSFAGGGVGEISNADKPRTGAHNADAQEDELLLRPSLEAGVFGVLFCLSQEKSQQHITYRWILLKIALDAWQIFTTIVTPSYGWDIDSSATWWKVLAVLNFDWLPRLGYSWYVGILYSIAGLLAVNLLLCVWVAYSFKVQKFDYVWPLVVVRGFSYVFIQVFDITSLSFLQIGFSCNYFGDERPRLHMSLFPAYSCTVAPHLIHAVSSAALLLLFVVVAMLVNMSEVEVNPMSKSPMALGNSSAEVTAFGIKALMTLVGVFLGWPKVAAAAYLLLALGLAWQYLRWAPHLVHWINCLKSGVGVAMAGVAGLQLAVVLAPASAAPLLTVAMGAALAPLFLAGAAACWLRLRLFNRAVRRAFSTTDHEAVLPKDVYPFASPRDIEIAARSARVWTDLYNLDKPAVHQADTIVKAGVALYPDSAFVTLVQANMMLDMLGFSQTGAKQLDAARKLSPGPMCRFMLFIRQQQATQKAASSNVGAGGNMDLLGYVEYQRKQRMVLRHHKDALQAMANFWRILGSSSVSFSSLSKSLESIDTSVLNAESAYRVVLEHYSSSPRLVRLYARFLETVKHDPWGAAEYYSAADKLEENKDEDGMGPTLPDGTPLSRMDEVDKGVLVVNAFGDIQVANKKLHAMFGYKKGELDGKNVMMIMPAHEAKRHPALLRRYIDSGDKAAPYFRHPVLGIHRERVAFTVRIAVSRASGLGEDSVFIGMIEPQPSDPGTGRLWVTAEGIIVCCDFGFVTCFGYRPEDVNGTQLETMLRWDHPAGGAGAGARRPSSSDSEDLGADVWTASKAIQDNHAMVLRMLGSAHVESAAAGSANGPQTSPSTNCRVTHMYDIPRECGVTVRRDKTKSTISEVILRLLSDEPQLLMVVEKKGVIRHMSGDLAKALGVGSAGETRGPPGGPAGGPPVVGANGVHSVRGSAAVYGSSAGGYGGYGGGTASGYAGGSVLGGVGGKPGGDDQILHDMSAEAANRQMEDFLPLPWRHLHHKVIKHAGTGVAAALLAAWGCRASPAAAPGHHSGHGVHAGAHAGHAGARGPTMRMLSASGLPVFVHVAVTSRQEEGQTVQVVRMARSSLETAVAECRIRVRVSETGTVQGVLADGEWAKGGLELFGFPADQLIGCHVWDFMSLNHPPPPVGSGGNPGSSGGRGGPPQDSPDVLLEAAAMMGGGGADEQQQQQQQPGEGDGLGLRTFDAMITSALQSPGISWRVMLAPPSAAADAEALGNPARAAALLSKRTRSAVLRLDVSLPPVGSGPAGFNPHGARQLEVVMELWDADAITGVLELDGNGRVTALLEEEVRPAGLLFGLSREDLLGAPLAALLQLGPKQSAVGLLTESGIAKKSALKTSKSSAKKDEAAAAVKVGPQHRLDAFHRDGQPAGLAVQVVGKPGSGNPITAIIRFAPPPKARNRGPGAAAAAAGAPHHAAFSAAALDNGGAAHRLLLSRAASRRRTEGDDSDAESVYSRFAPPSTVAGAPAGSPRRRAEMIRLRAGEEGRSVTTAPTPAPAPPVVPPLPLAGLTAAGSGDPVSSRGVQLGILPVGAAALAAGVACLITQRPGAARGRGSRTAAGSSPAGSGVDASAVDSVARPGGSPSSSPPKPSSPPTAGHGKTREASPRSGAALAGVAEGDEEGGGGEVKQLLPGEAQRASGAAPVGPVLRAASLASVDSDAEDKRPAAGGAGAAKGSNIHKWVATSGEYYQNTARSVGGESDFEREAFGDDDDDDRTSVGGASHAASSRHGSPQSSFRAAGAAAAAAAAAALDSPADPPADGEGGHEAGHDADDARSEGGDSGMSDLSGVSGTSGNSEANSPADFKRGKRYRKLVRLMDSPQAQRAVVLFKLRTALVVAAAWGVHVLCFALIITAVNTEIARLDALGNGGRAQTFMQRAMVGVRALDQVYRGRGGNNTYTIAQYQEFADEVLSYSRMYRDVNSQVLMESSHAGVEDLYYTRQIEVFSGFNLTTGASFNANLTMLDLVTRFFVSCKEVAQSHALWHSAGTQLADTLPGAFLLRSGEALIPPSRQVLDILLDAAVAQTSYLNLLQLAFLLLEGFVVALGTAAFLIILFRAACEMRYKLYETFLTIPIGLTRALASETTHLLDDDESEEEEEEGEDGGASVNKDAHDGDAPAKRKALFESPAAADASTPVDMHSPAVHQHHPQPGGHGHAAAHAHHGGATATAVTAFGNHHRNHRASLDESAAAPKKLGAYGDGGGGGISAMWRSPGSVRFGGGGGGALDAYDPAPGARQPGLKGWLSWAGGKIWRSGSVRPLPPGPQRRALKRNSRVVNGMVAVVAIYSCLIILFYSVDYVLLRHASERVAMQSVADHTSERTYRAVFYAQELVAEADPAAVRGRVADLRAAAAALLNAYQILRIGPDHWRVAAPDGVYEDFYMAAGRGLTRESAAMYALFFADGACLREAANLPCPPPTYRYHQVTYSGVDGMMSQMLLELGLLADEAEAGLAAAAAAAGGGGGNGSLPDLGGSAHWDYIYNVGTLDLSDGTARISEQHRVEVDHLFNVVVNMHVVLFLLLAGVFACLVFTIILPLLRRMRNEKRRIAEMMSQLPSELDVMRLVSVALMGAASAAATAPSHPHGRRRALPGAAVGEKSMTAVAAGAPLLPLAAVAGEHSPRGSGGHDASGTAAAGDGTGTAGGGKAYHAWKDILARASSVGPNNAGGPAGAQPGPKTRISGQFG